MLEECVLVRKSTGGNVIQNPSDAGATYDGHKGAGYQMQLSETCSDQNEVQLVVGAIPETAAAEYGDALVPMVEQLHEHDRLPDELLADTSYGSDANVQAAEAVGVDLVAPVRGRAPQASAEHCGSCPLLTRCPIKRQRDGSYELQFTDKDRRLAARRREESTDVFAERYALRAGIESLNSGVKNRLGMKRLPVRGKGAVFRVMMNKVTGWNILRAATTDKLRAWVSEEVKKLLGSNWAWSCGQLGHVIEPSQRALGAFVTLSTATSSPPPRLAA